MTTKKSKKKPSVLELQLAEAWAAVGHDRMSRNEFECARQAFGKQLQILHQEHQLGSVRRPIQAVPALLNISDTFHCEGEVEEAESVQNAAICIIAGLEPTKCNEGGLAASELFEHYIRMYQGCLVGNSADQLKAYAETLKSEGRGFEAERMMIRAAAICGRLAA